MWDSIFNDWAIDCFIEECHLGPAGSQGNNAIRYRISFLQNDLLLRGVVATWGFVISEIFARSVDIFGADRDDTYIGRFERYLVLVMVLNVQNTTVMKAVVDCVVSTLW